MLTLTYLCIKECRTSKKLGVLMLVNDLLILTLAYYGT